MTVDITIPSPGESISEVVVGPWHRSTGQWVDKDEIIVEIESDKVTLEVPAPESGVLSVTAPEGTELGVGDVIGTIDPDAERPAAGEARHEAPPPEEPPAAVPGDGQPRSTPVARKVAADKGVDLARVAGTGPSGRITKSDVLAVAESAGPAQAAHGAPAAPTASATEGAAAGREVRRERLTKLRQRIAQRLVAAQQTAAMLTTFNEVDMSAVMQIRSAHKEAFQEAHGVGLGFMSFFVKACVAALRKYARVNAYIAGDEVEYHDYVDMSIAVGTDKGLVVPVIRNAESLTYAGIESAIQDLADRARRGKLSLEEMTGGTFTISNGGVYGSMLSTPILNPPQSAILGMHRITRRPVEDPQNPGQIALRPMMYLALSYDHRIVDGEQAVGFLVHVRQCLEAPDRMMLGV